MSQCNLDKFNGLRVMTVSNTAGTTPVVVQLTNILGENKKIPILQLQICLDVSAKGHECASACVPASRKLPLYICSLIRLAIPWGIASTICAKIQDIKECVETLIHGPHNI